MLKQSQEFSTEALNAHQRTLRMRGRPKIVLARTYQEAMEVYRKYQNNILGVITDVRFPKVERGEKDGLAGIKLCAEIRKNDPFVPVSYTHLFPVFNVYARYTVSGSCHNVMVVKS